MNFNDLNNEQLKEILDNVNKLADVMQASRATNFSGDDAAHQKDLDEAERGARAYAKNRNAGGGTMPSHEAHLPNDEKIIVEETRNWIARQKKRGWFPK
jgi:hypothetical protein